MPNVNRCFCIDRGVAIQAALSANAFTRDKKLFYDIFHILGLNFNVELPQSRRYKDLSSTSRAWLKHLAYKVEDTEEWSMSFNKLSEHVKKFTITLEGEVRNFFVFCISFEIQLLQN